MSLAYEDTFDIIGLSKEYKISSSRRLLLYYNKKAKKYTKNKYHIGDYFGQEFGMSLILVIQLESSMGALIFSEIIMFDP